MGNDKGRSVQRGSVWSCSLGETLKEKDQNRQREYAGGKRQ